MKSQTSQQAVIESETLERVEEKIQQEIMEILKISNFRTLLEENGISKDRVLKIKLECHIELAPIPSTGAVDNKQPQGFLPAGLGPVVLKLQCCEDWQGNCIKC
ncbi:hypothetical protein ANSO36C_19420 [Nostoc cf. commune SO-36]|uniref:Uncharacterized protein n=1 Tax=Nostoc cf. commune SO-36 TaxID=449208 RepID=A0ABM7YZK8_NOSCO|nr:hypothetical protein [Nostoc commune]BDI16140.1 hypothetical protein ANSO36C_19420 [Nostoc cf. commune SO-36]